MNLVGSRDVTDAGLGGDTDGNEKAKISKLVRFEAVLNLPPRLSRVLDSAETLKNRTP